MLVAITNVCASTRSWLEMLFQYFAINFVASNKTHADTLLEFAELYIIPGKGKIFVIGKSQVVRRIST